MLMMKPPTRPGVPFVGRRAGGISGAVARTKSLDTSRHVPARPARVSVAPVGMTARTLINARPVATTEQGLRQHEPALPQRA